MSQTKYVKATDTLRIHFTTLGHVYEVLEQDDECYKISDDRGKPNWVPFRYFSVVEADAAASTGSEGAAEESEKSE